MTNQRIGLPCAAANAKSYRSDDQITRDAIEDDDVREVLRIFHAAAARSPARSDAAGFAVQEKSAG